MYFPIEQLQKLATTSGIPYIVQHKLAYFKIHFENNQTKLKEIRGPTMQHVWYHHANVLAAQLHIDLQRQGHGDSSDGTIYGHYR